PGTANTATVALGMLNGAPPASALVGGGGAAGSTNISIFPFTTASTGAGVAGTTLVTYGPNGLRALNTATEFAASLQSVPYATGATDNVRTVVPLVVASQPVTANSLTFATNTNIGVYGIGLTGRVNLTSGLIHNTTSTSFLG